MLCSIPYGKNALSLRVDAGMDVEVLESGAHRLRRRLGEDDVVRKSLENPIGSPPLPQLAMDKRTAVIICSDHTRPVPSRRILPPLLAQLRQGNPTIDVTLLIATGFHRGTTRAELVEKLGKDIVSHERIVVHDCTDERSLVHLGALPSGAPLTVNRLAAQADLLLAEGFIEPHFFAGFSGGRKSVLPGVCGRETVLGNHCAAFIGHPCARTGILEGNPLHRDMLDAARKVGLSFIVNVILDGHKHVMSSFAGHPVQAHAVGCTHLRSLCAVPFRRPGDIVVTSNGGAPLDQNLYQAVKGLTAAEAAAAPGAVLILAAACVDGAGGASFERMLSECASPAALLEAIARVPMEHTAPDQWEAQILARILCKHRVILVCEQAMAPVARRMKLDTAASLNEAFAIAVAQQGPTARLTVIPDGVSVIVTPVP